MSLLRKHWIYDSLGNALNSVLGALKTSLHDGIGNPLKSTEGALHIHDAEIDKIPFNEHFHQHTGAVDTLAAASVAGAISITVTNGTLFTALSYIQIENGVIETTFPQITSIAGNVLNLDRPVDNAFSIGDTVEEVNFNMSVAGTISAPISFRIIPDLDQIWHVHGFGLTMLLNSAWDDSNFGDLAALPNGVVIRAYNGLANQHRTFTLWKTNADIGLDTGTLKDKAKAPSGLYGLSADGDIAGRSGAIPELNGANGDYLEMLIQDDLSGLVDYVIKVQGHVELT